MKKTSIILAVAGLIGGVFSVEGQSAHLASRLAGNSLKDELNAIQSNQVAVRTLNSAAIKLNGLSPAAVVATLHAPKKITKAFSEYDNKEVTTYAYAGLEISFIQNHAVDVQILSKEASLVLSKVGGGEVTIRPGGPMKVLSGIFHQSYVSSKNNQTRVSLKTSKGLLTDAAIVFETDPTAVPSGDKDGSNRIKTITIVD